MLKQKLILGYSSQIAGQFFTIIAAIVVARVAGPSVLGTVAFGMAYVSMWFFLSDLGIGTAHVKLISEGQDIAACNATYLRLRIIATCIFTVFLISLFIFQKSILKLQFESIIHEYVIFIFLMISIINSLSMIPQTTFAALTEQAKKDIPLLGNSFVSSILKIMVVLLGGKALGISFANLIAIIMLFVVYAFLFRKYPVGKYNKILAKKYIVISIPIFVIALSTSIIAYADRVMLGFFTNSTQVGYYTAGFRIGSLVQMVGNSVGLLFFPIFSAAFSNNDISLIIDRINKFERFSYIFIMPCVILACLYSNIIVKILLGDQYINSIVPMAIINISMFIYIMAMPYGNVLTGKGNFVLAAIIYITSLLIFLIAQYLLISKSVLDLKATGTSIGLLIVNIYLYCCFRIYSIRKAGKIFVSNSKFMVFGVCQLLILFAIHHWVKQYMPSICFECLLVLLYLIEIYMCMILLKLIKREDWQVFLSIFKLRDMKKYIFQEFYGKTK